jgi:hypothetical protein
VHPGQIHPRRNSDLFKSTIPEIPEEIVSTGVAADNENIRPTVSIVVTHRDATRERARIVVIERPRDSMHGIDSRAGRLVGEIPGGLDQLRGEDQGCRKSRATQKSEKGRL